MYWAVIGVRRLAWILVLLLAATPALAQGSGAAAEALYREGKELLKNKQYAEACEKLQESQRLDPAAGTLGLLALCNELSGKTATAWQQYLKVASLARDAGQKQRERAAKRQAEKLEKRLSTMRIKVSAPVAELKVTRRGRVVGSAQWDTPIPVDPGRVLVEASAPGYQPWSKLVEVGAEADKVEVTVPPLQKAESVPPPKAAPATPAKPAPPARGTPAPTKDEAGGSFIGENALGLVAIGVGAVGIGVGSYFGLRASSKNDESKEFCNDEDECHPRGFEIRDEAKQAATISNIAFGVGVVAVGAGIFLIATSGGGETTEQALSWTPHLSPHGGGATLGGRF
jgi:serine/threonine-protein kinase